MSKLRAPYPWFGGKSSVADQVWRRFGDVRNFVDPFLGSAAMLLCRPIPFEGSETVNDLDCYVANFWRAVQTDSDSVAHYADWPVNEADLHARHHWLVNSTAEWRERMHIDPDYYDVKIAGWWVWGLCQWIGGGWCSRPEWKQRPHLGDAGRGVHRPHRRRPQLKNGGMGVNRTRQQLPHPEDEREADIYDYINALKDRFRRVRVCCGDWSRVLGPTPTVHNGLTAVFLDPPYSHESRDDELYAEESTSVAHDARRWCIEHGGDKRLRIALCGYDGEHNELEDHGWTVEAWKANGGYGAKTDHGSENATRERIWYSPHCLSDDLPLFRSLA